ncbi:glycosyltransferase [Brevibacterium aurantiacum]|uniref:glycosyltransferase n=1 Tax=Brevibacterium aurantiacum TaxID=273384 RepID=UPI000F0A7A68|nr:glycosyltransferase [Brevibacterium aurantiacum]
MDTKRQKLVAFPIGTENPYIAMLHHEVKSDWDVIEVKGTSELFSLAASLETGDVFHIHWTAPIASYASNVHEAELNRSEFRGFLELLLSRGIRILWTVHNEAAHDSPYPDVERRLAQDLAECSDLIIQLHNETVSALKGSVDLPRCKLRTLPHCSYLGVYPDGKSSAKARKELGVPPNGKVVGFIGQLRGYKGLDTLFRAVDIAAETTPDLVLLVAGQLNPSIANSFHKSLPKRVRVISQFERIADSEMWMWFRACDAIALPYRRVLNSGTLILAAGFGRPVIVPDDTPLAAVYRDQRWVYSYSSHRNEAMGLASRISSICPLPLEDYSAAREFAWGRPASEMASGYRAIVRQFRRF